MRVGILTISDRAAAGDYEDRAGPVIRDMVTGSLGWEVAATAIAPDEVNQIRDVLIQWSDVDRLNLVVTTGGTGFAPRDVTPEATRTVIDREAPGLAEAMRAWSLRVTPHAMLSRAVCGIRKQTLIVNLPGSPRAVKEQFDVLLPVLPHALDLLNESPGSEAGHQSLRKV